MTAKQNQPKSITLQEFEELAEKFIEEQFDGGRHSCSGDSQIAIYYFDEFKAFVFKQDLEQEARRKEYEEIKEKYFKLKDEFEGGTTEEKSVVKFTDHEGEYIAADDKGNSTCQDCAFRNKPCGHVCDFYSCGQNHIIWIKAT